MSRGAPVRPVRPAAPWAAAVLAVLVAMAGGAGGARAASSKAPAGVPPVVEGRGQVVTDAFVAKDPPAPWRRWDGLPSTGVASWMIQGPKDKNPTASLELSYLATGGGSARAEIDDALNVIKRAIRSELEGREGVDRGSFEADSMQAGGLSWRGFRVTITAPSLKAVSYRWIALHPSFPAVRRALLVEYDAYGPADQPLQDRAADARALAAGVRPVGRGLAGPLDEAWVDGRAVAFAARIDSAQKLCWHARPEAAAARAYAGFGLGLAVEGDFIQVAPSIPRDSLVDAGAVEYGVVFDRNRDGRYDLFVVNRGVVQGTGGLFPAVSVLADDDFDGRIDGCVIETGDTDGDGKADHRIWVSDTNHDGRPDVAVRFLEGIREPGRVLLPVEDGRVSDRLVGQTGAVIDFTDNWRDYQSFLGELNQFRPLCAH